MVKKAGLGNHSNTQVPDLSYCEVSGNNIKDIINDSGIRMILYQEFKTEAPKL